MGAQAPQEDDRASAQPQATSAYRATAAPDIRIAPDRRPFVAALLLSAGAVIGGAALHFGEGAWSRRGVPADHAGASSAGLRGRRIAPATLSGPGGPTTLPTGRPVVINVWLQGCADCMPAFEAMRELDARAGLRGVDVVNVAYGSADPAWAKRYGVAQRLVYDEGGAKIVQPLGIGTFTTLVVDGNGAVRFVDRPDRLGYEERVRGAFSALGEP
jgi:thiol-disulfide isomerase/thioredoxin